MYTDGVNIRRIARFLRVNHQSVANWVHAYQQKLAAAHPEPPLPKADEVETVEMDELFTFVGKKGRSSMSSSS
jgi:transposase-like protein